jgi:hypothetical protein
VTLWSSVAPAKEHAVQLCLINGPFRQFIRPSQLSGAKEIVEPQASAANTIRSVLPSSIANVGRS